MHLTTTDRAAALSLVASMQGTVRRLQHHGGPEDAHYLVPRESRWQPLAGRDGVEYFHVPAPDEADALYSAHFETVAGARYAGSLLDCSRLVVVGRGVLDCNGRALRPGQSLWLAPGQPTNWHSPHGCSGVVFYDVPNPDLTP